MGRKKREPEKAEESEQLKPCCFNCGHIEASEGGTRLMCPVGEDGPEPLKKKVRSGEVLRKVVKSMSNERPDKLVKYFEGKPVEFRSENGKLWLTMKQVGEHLGYESDPAHMIDKLYLAHKDEFDSDCTQMTYIGISVNRPPLRERIFSLDGLILLCIFSEKPIAKKFRAWLRKVGREVIVTGSYTLPGVVPQSAEMKTLETVTQALIQVTRDCEVAREGVHQSPPGFTESTPRDFRGSRVIPPTRRGVHAARGI